jgi:hypothetical protein
MSRAVRVAAPSLKTSGVFSQQSLAPYLSGNPLFADAAEDKMLASWLSQWYAAPGAITALQKAELQQILSNSTLAYQSLINIGRSVLLRSQDYWTASAFYAAAVLRAKDQLDAFQPGDPAARPILIALNSTKPTLWRLADAGDNSFVPQLYKLNYDLVYWTSPDDQSLQDARAYGFIGLAECLYVMNENQDAVAAAMSIDTAQMTDSQKVAVAWIRGLTLFVNNRFNEAADQFIIVTKAPAYKYSEAAYHRLILSYLSAGDLDSAKKVYAEWIAIYNPSPDDRVAVLARINYPNHE